ncbi:DUF3472 domain-containing protein [Duganella sp. Root1480D1]|uniref:DUF3472 domain-containing protein n=1 Tax=Duganella sp. Root1480D1 TaxID=1736471 RepID=UPI0009E8B92D|nr:DUF5077 domain-containing protein [Duganella sp. Root1480D1]
MKRRISLLILAFSAAAALAGQPVVSGDAVVALAGNGFVTSADSASTEVIDNNGLSNWTSPNTVTSIWFHMSAAGNATFSLDAGLSGSKSSKIRVTANGTPFDITLAKGRTKTYAVGSINVPAAGYVRVDLQGISKSGTYFGEVSALRVNTTTALNYANDAANYYWSRRGPSVHLGYTVPANTEYFYNEVTVPAGEDKIGAYFMANGFNGGYFGIQVNSPTERRVLFSIWDADNGAKTTLVRKGPNVVDNTFGGEGTGGQSYLLYNWAAGNTYRFITRTQPDGAGNTDFSAWFYAPETNAWRLIATWKRPATTTYHAGVYSFLENFIDTNGYLGRSVQFNNQWARSTSGNWSELVTARFTGDATAANAQRMDYAGGLQNGSFYLRNGGFFSPHVAINQNFTRPATGQVPAVDVSTLP